MQDASGNIVSRNFYWLSTHPDVFNWEASTWYFTPLQSYADFKNLATLPKVKLELSSRGEIRSDEPTERVTVRNPSSNVAFFVHLKVIKGKGGGDVRPILWQDNDFELVPGEQREVTAAYRVADLGGAHPVIAISGWNVVSGFGPSGP